MLGIPKKIKTVCIAEFFFLLSYFDSILRSSVVIIFIVFFLSSCKCEKKEESHEEGGPEELKPLTIKDFGPDIQALVKSDSGVFRNVVFEMPIDDVRKMEDVTKLVESGENYLNYTVHLDSLEDADVLYYFDADSNVTKIEVDIYPNAEDSRAKLFKEFSKYFNVKYGEPTSEIEEVKIWTAPDKNLKVEMRMLGNSKIHDLQIDFKEAEENP